MTPLTGNRIQRRRPRRQRRGGRRSTRRQSWTAALKTTDTQCRIKVVHRLWYSILLCSERDPRWRILHGSHRVQTGTHLKDVRWGGLGSFITPAPFFVCENTRKPGSAIVLNTRSYTILSTFPIHFQPISNVQLCVCVYPIHLCCCRAGCCGGIHNEAR